MHRPPLAIDFDGVIAETLSRKSAWIAQHLGLTVTPADCSKTHCEPLIGADNYRRMGRELGYADTLDCPAFEGAKEGLDRLSRIFAIYVFTARPEEKTRWAKEWFHHHGMSGLIQGVVSTYGRSKAKMAAAMNSCALVDNDIRHLQDETPSSLRRLHFCPAKAENSEKKGIERVGGWDELVYCLTRMSRPVAWDVA